MLARIRSRGGVRGRGGVASMASGAGLTVRRLVAGRGAWPRVAAYNGAMGCPKRGRVLEASRPALRACNRQFYAEGRVLGSRTRLSCQLPLYASRQAPWTPHGALPGQNRLRGRVVIVISPRSVFCSGRAQITLRAVSYNRCA